MKNFLIVDDSPDDRALIRTWIEATDDDHTIDEADNVEDAIKLYGTNEFSCVLLDYHFPTETAQDFLKSIQKDERGRLRSPVIVVTGQGNDEVAVQCIKAGASDYINKDRLNEPGHVAAKIVKRVLSEHQQLQEIERSQTAEKAALIAALRSQEDLERSITDLKRAKLSADAANVSKSAFLANMSHEIRSPLTSILGFTQLLRDTPLMQDEQRDYLQAIEKNSEHLLNVINEILDFSKVEAGKVSLVAVEFDIHALVYELVENFSRAAKAKNVIMRVFLHPNFPRLVTSDPTRVRQILTNLLSNSVKFTDRGEIAVIAQSEPSVKGSERFSIVVSDSGDGINKIDASKLFKRFAQANESISARYGGTGLGLVLSKKLANLLGGNLELISSEPGVGSLFKVTLPLFFNSADSNHPRPTVRRVLDANVLTGYSILVVDDSLDNQLLLRRLPGRMGADVSCLSDGIEAVEQAPKMEMDVVIMDVQMPNLDGHEAARLLRSRGYKIPIIGLTAHALPEDQKKSQAAGFNDQLTKPIDTSALVAAILTHAHKREGDSEMDRAE